MLRHRRRAGVGAPAAACNVNACNTQVATLACNPSQGFQGSIQPVWKQPWPTTPAATGPGAPGPRGSLKRACSLACQHCSVYLPNAQHRSKTPPPTSQSPRYPPPVTPQPMSPPPKQQRPEPPATRAPTLQAPKNRTPQPAPKQGPPGAPTGHSPGGSARARAGALTCLDGLPPRPA